MDSVPDCPFCLSVFSESEPGYLLYCGHTLHQNCLNRVKITTEIICPSCRSVTPGNLDSLKKNQSLMRFLEKINKENESKNKILCEECDAMATVYCEQCAISVCETHNTYLHSLKAVSKHKRYDISLKPAASTKCKEHDEPFKLFCNACNLSLCYICHESGSHTHHQVQSISSLMKEYQSLIENLLKATDETDKKFEDYLKQYSQYIDKIKDNSTSREKEIDLVMDNLIAVINKRREVLKGELRDQSYSEEHLINHEREVMAIAKAEIQVVIMELKGILVNINSEVLSEINIESFKTKLSDWDGITKQIDKKKIDIHDYLIPASFDLNHYEKRMSHFGKISPSERLRKIQDTEKRIRDDEDRKIREEADKIKEETGRKIKEETDRKIREGHERKLREDSERRSRAEEEKKNPRRIRTPDP